ncbi:hypothetical protein ABZ916_00010 [Streptomyces sp. NPDC046853]|uniref:hypothetical protein n=1 Tax=Streptomyces sp. NPDC046853 TaxID=3154920 RepID=UPI0033F5B04D
MSTEEVENLIRYPARPPLTTRSWSVLRDFSVGRMQAKDVPDSDRLRWGAVAVEAARRKHSEGGIDRAAALAEEAISRSYLIRTFGPGEVGSVRDPGELFRRVIDVLGERSREELSAAARSWRELPGPEILALRRIKNLLNPLTAVVDTLESEEERDELEKWLALIPVLP